MTMKPIPLFLGATLLLLIGLVGILGLAVPELRAHLTPHWAVVASSASLVLTGFGLLRQCRWALFVFLVCWGGQALVVLASGQPVYWGSGLVGLVLVVSLCTVYWERLQ
ncbi:hypothetical protein D3C71_1317230 [compost metagenome]|jgi:hypothetical protein